MNKISLGHRGEDLAEEFLKNKHHIILERNFRSRFGEIDLITVYDGCIHFIEVKTRGSIRFGRPAESVDKRKLQHFRMTAEIYIQSHRKRNNEGIRYSMDVIEIGINHMEGI